MKHIVIYRAHGQLAIETKHYGPFDDHDDAYDFLCTLPAVGIALTDEEKDNPGCKYTAQLFSPEDVQ